MEDKNREWFNFDRQGACGYSRCMCLLSLLHNYENGFAAGVGPQQNETKDWNLGLDYNKYLQQVVEVTA